MGISGSRWPSSHEPAALYGTTHCETCCENSFTTASVMQQTDKPRQNYNLTIWSCWLRQCHTCSAACCQHLQCSCCHTCIAGAATPVLQVRSQLYCRCGHTHSADAVTPAVQVLLGAMTPAVKMLSHPQCGCCHTCKAGDVTRPVKTLSHLQCRCCYVLSHPQWRRCHTCSVGADRCYQHLQCRLWHLHCRQVQWKCDSTRTADADSTCTVDVTTSALQVWYHQQ